MARRIIAQVTFTDQDIDPGIIVTLEHQKRIEEAMTQAGFEAMENLGLLTPSDDED